MKSELSQNEKVDLYTRVKAAFLLQGTSFNRWCLSNGVKRQNAAHALKGVWNGAKSTELKQKIIIAAGIEKDTNHGQE